MLREDSFRFEEATSLFWKIVFVTKEKEKKTMTVRFTTFFAIILINVIFFNVLVRWGAGGKDLLVSF